MSTQERKQLHQWTTRWWQVTLLVSHSGMKQVNIFMQESVNHSLNWFTQKHETSLEGKWAVFWVCCLNLIRNTTHIHTQTHKFAVCIQSDCPHNTSHNLFTDSIDWFIQNTKQLTVFMLESVNYSRNPSVQMHGLIHEQNTVVCCSEMCYRCFWFD